MRLADPRSGKLYVQSLTPDSKAMIGIAAHEWVHAHQAYSIGSKVEKIAAPTALNLADKSWNRTPITTVTINSPSQDRSDLLLKGTINALIGPAHDTVHKRFKQSGLGHRDLREMLNVPLQPDIGEDYITAERHITSLLTHLTNHTKNELKPEIERHLSRSYNLSKRLAKYIPFEFTTHLANSFLLKKGGEINGNKNVFEFYKDIINIYPESKVSSRLINKETLAFVQRTKDIITKEFGKKLFL